MKQLMIVQEQKSLFVLEGCVRYLSNLHATERGRALIFGGRGGGLRKFE